MRLRQSAALTVAAATSVLAFPALPASAATAGNTLYVDQKSASCTDAGTGSQANPYCTISAAAAAVRPGQTVKVAAMSGVYAETVTIGRSGTPEQPITFLGLSHNEIRPMLAPAKADASGFVLTGVHDVVVQGFVVRRFAPGTAPLVGVRDSDRVTIDQMTYGSRTGGPSVQVSGGSGDLTVSRSRFIQTGGVEVGAGAHDVLISANEFNRITNEAVTATDAPRTAVTNNTIAFTCEGSVRIDGTSPGAVIENNVITAEHKADTGATPTPDCATAPASRGQAEVAVSAGSVSGSKVDYNLLHPRSGGFAYAWAGSTYPTAAAFTAAQPGQAAHDVDVDISFDTTSSALRLPAAATAGIDSTDPTAPGVPSDLTGVKPVDHPEVANSGGVRDRGAYEVSGQSSASLTLTTRTSSMQGPPPFTVQATAWASNTWGLAQAAYHFDFGDGSSVDSTTSSVSHTYTSPGSYSVTATVTDTLGGTVTSRAQLVEVKPAADLTVGTSVTKNAALGVTVTSTLTSPYVLHPNYMVDFGDGDLRYLSVNELTVQHQYRAPGTYQITVQASDEGYRSATSRKTVQVSSAGYDASIAPGERVQLFALPQDGSTPANTGANYTLGAWAPFLPVRTTMLPQPATTVSAAAITAGQYVQLFSLSKDGRVFTAARNLGSDNGLLKPGEWQQWDEVTLADQAGALPGITQLSATTLGNVVHLVAVAKGRVYETSGYQGGWEWLPWGDITGTLGYPADVTSAAAASIGNVMHVAMLSSDGRIRVGDADYDRRRWSGGELTAAVGRLPGKVTQVAAAATPGSKFHVVALADGKVYEAGGDYAAGRWTNWGNITAETGLPALTRVAAAGTGNSLRVFGLTTGNQIMNADGNYTLGRWTKAQRVDTASAAGPVNPFSSQLIGDLSVAGR
ncbi:PKD domain-containing protein [Kitasatospora cineracea]